MWIFPQNTFTLSLCGFGNFILTVVLAKDKKEQKRDMGVERAHRFCKVLLDVFIHFYVRIISSHVSVRGGAKMMCSWLMGRHLNFWSLRAFPRSLRHLIDRNMFYLNRQPHLFIWSKCMFAHSHHSYLVYTFIPQWIVQFLRFFLVCSQLVS